MLTMSDLPRKKPQEDLVSPAPKYLHDVIQDGVWAGKRCFIVGGGESLKDFDYSQLEGELIIGVNRAFEKIDPSIIIFADSRLWGWIENGSLGPEAQKKFKDTKSLKVAVEANIFPYPQEVLRLKEYKGLLSESIIHGVALGGNSGFAAVNLALCLGADEIYLLGFDMHGKAGKQVWWHEGYPEVQEDCVYQGYIDKFNEAAGEMRSRARIVNLNRNSALKCFEFGDFPKDNIWFNGYYGLGDNIYERPFVLDAVKRYNKVFLTTPFPELYHKIDNLFFIKPQTELKTQKRNIEAQPNSIWSELSGKCVMKHFDYHRGRIQRGLNIAQGFEDSVGKVKEYDFSMPVKPDWVNKAKAILSGIKTDKKICIIKYPTVRAEWCNPARNPKIEYLQLLIDKYRDEYFYISVADARSGEEWLDGELTGIDLQLNNGETDVFTTFGLCALSDMVIGFPSYFLPLCLSLKKKFFCLYGGSIKPELLTDAKMGIEIYGYAAPDPFCNCISNTHQCNKEIPETKIIENFEELRARKKKLLLVRMQPKNAVKILNNRFISEYYDVYTLGSSEYVETYKFQGGYKGNFAYGIDDMENVISGMDLVVIAQKLCPASEDAAALCRRHSIRYLWAEAFFDNRMVFDYSGLQYCPENEINQFVGKTPYGEIRLPENTREAQPKTISDGDLFHKYGLRKDDKHIVIFGQTVFDMSLQHSINPKIKDFRDYIDLIASSNPDVTFIYKDHPLYKTAFKDRQDTAFVRGYKNLVVVDESIDTLFNVFECFTSFSSTTIFEGVIRKKKFATCGLHFCDNDKLVLRLSGDVDNLYLRIKSFNIDENIALQCAGFICNQYAIDLSSRQLFHKFTMRPEEYYDYNWSDYRWTL